jgi:hypothetical protein
MTRDTVVAQRLARVLKRAAPILLKTRSTLCCEDAFLMHILVRLPEPNYM